MLVLIVVVPPRRPDSHVIPTPSPRTKLTQRRRLPRDHGPLVMFDLSTLTSTSFYYSSSAWDSSASNSIVWHGTTATPPP
ncbi:hypothetical protein Hypma_001301 [Hypsizygus marmoreus]|uniref:Uncharacterized protein n=1 Tax=Hypsizygus marmoreus TaxID=39966 RepID=A0A369K116_HYPMA|nr:hypothetical protein Hypma_001301 [Hypsizygus marmoreus]